MRHWNLQISCGKQQGCLKGRRPPLHARGTRPVFPAPSSTPRSSTAKENAVRKRRGSGSGSSSQEGATSDGGAESSRNGSGSDSRDRSRGRGHVHRGPSLDGDCCTGGPRPDDKTWGARRRDSRVNGADIYVARVTKVGMGTARPCWRCLEWCRWAGVKRIFHWNAEDGRFDAVKVNSAERNQYETHADIRLFAGLVSALSLA